MEPHNGFGCLRLRNYVKLLNWNCNNPEHALSFLVSLTLRFIVFGCTQIGSTIFISGIVEETQRSLGLTKKSFIN